MEGGSSYQDENRDENAYNDANAGENRALRTQNQGTETEPLLDLSTFTLCFPHGLGPEDVVSENTAIERQDFKDAVCCICCNDVEKLYALSIPNQTYFQELLKKVYVDGMLPSPPHLVCSECNDTLTATTDFRAKALQTNSLLYALVSPFIIDRGQPPQGTVNPVIVPCTHRHHGRRSQPYINPGHENIRSRTRRLSFCVMQRVPYHPGLQQY